MDLGEKQNEFYQWQKANFKSVPVIPISEIPEAKKLLKKFRPQKQQCYRNATEACLWDDRIGYVEGLAALYFPIDHAWNVWLPTGQHFDLTAERCCGAFDEYGAVVVATYPEIAPLLLLDGMFGNIPKKKFFEERKKK